MMDVEEIRLRLINMEWVLIMKSIIEGEARMNIYAMH